ncbi:MAG TPA: BACON domain-containing carbohydrate-binding protein, partial [Bryobacteraceae bacterium]|nr:BACON domain-containing carbohydrate-binding protein [Bryobacteraceae bacterium]
MKYALPVLWALAGSSLLHGQTVSNAASLAGGVSPGEVVVINGLPPLPGAAGTPDPLSVAIDPGGLPYSLLGVSVTFGGIPAPLFAVSTANGQGSITAQAPFELPVGTTSVSVKTPSSTIAIPNVAVKLLQPGIFEHTDTDGHLRAVLQRLDGSTVTPSNPARSGEQLRMFVTGLGQVFPSAQTNKPGAATPQVVVATVVVGESGQGVPLVAAKYASNAIGVYTVDFFLPLDVPSGQDISLSVGAISPDSTVVYSQLSHMIVVSSVSPVTGLQIVSGNNQSAATGAGFAQPLVVKANSGGGVAAGVPVRWTIANGSATLSASTITTDSNGNAAVNVTAGPAPGPVSVVASATSNGSTFSVTFSLIVNAGPPLSISGPTSLTAATVGSSYSQTFTATGGIPPYTWSLAAGAVPGLTLSPAGVLSGTPTSAGTYQLTVRVQDSVLNASAAVLSLTVNRGCQPSQLLLQITSLQAGFRVVAGQPVTLQEIVSDDCGNPVPGGSVSGSFSNGDAIITLSGVGNGRYSGTWVPVGTGTVTILFSAFETVNGKLVGGQSSPLTGTVMAPVVSTLQVAPTSLTFSVQKGDSPTTQSLAVTSTGDPLTFAVSTSGGAWLAASPASGTTQASVTVTVDPTKLTTPGAYTGSVQFAVGATVVPVPVNVNFTVPAPKLVVPLTPLSFTAESGGGAPQPQVVTATASGGPVRFTTTASTTSGGGWLSVDPANGATDANLTISVHQGNLSSGPYSGTVTVKAPDANGGTFQIPIGLTVTAPTTNSLIATPTGLQFRHQINNTPPDSQALKISSSGDAVNFLATAKVSAGDPQWLLVSPRSGQATAQATATLTVSVQPGGLAAGTYNGSIQVDPSGSNATGVSVPVQLTVAPQPNSTLVTDTTQLTYFLPSNATPGQRQVTIAGTGPQLLNFNVQTATDVGSWLKVSRSSGGASANLPAIVVVTADPAGLAPATYSGKVTITPTGSSSPIVIPVGFTVGASLKALVLSQFALTFQVAQPNQQFGPQVVSIAATGQGTVNYTATAQSDGNWLTADPASGQVIAGSQQFGHITVQVNAGSLSNGEYHGQIQVQSPDVDNSPQFINVVLRVVKASDLSPQTAPTGLAFVATAGGAAPAAQPVFLFNPSGQLGYNPVAQLDPSNPAGTPLFLQFKDATKSGDFVNTMLVSVSPAGLSPNVYRGTILVVFPGNISRTVSVLLVVTPGSTGASSRSLASPRAASPVCVPSQYLPLFTSLEQNFSVSQGAPASTEIVVVDDCGNAVTSGTTGS